MKLKNQLHALKLLETFSNDIQDLKKKLIKEYIKEKFKKKELLFALEKLTEYEAQLYKKFNLYQSIDLNSEIPILYHNFFNIKKKCQQFLELYIKKN
jgi:hypothetical protein